MAAAATAVARHGRAAPAPARALDHQAATTQFTSTTSPATA